MTRPADGDEPLHDSGARPTRVLELFAAFLEALCDPEGGHDLYTMHAGDAPLRDAQGIAPAQSITPEAFARRHREICLEGAERLPLFSDPLLRHLTADPVDPETVAWFEVTDSRNGRSLMVALGTRTNGGVQRIVWCAPAGKREPWTFREGLLQSLADYPWMRTSDPPTPRALLDAGYFRRFPTTVEFQALPDARFSCRMSTACCRHDYEITLPAEAQWLIDAIPWQRIEPRLAGTRLTPRPDGRLQLKRPDESCRFLGSHGQCLIHQTLGRQPFGPCCVFPFSFAQTPQGIAVGLSPVCGSARLGLGISPRERVEDLRERLAHALPRSTDAYRLSPGLEVPWPRFRDIEQGLLDCLAAADLPVRRRLHVGARLLGALRSGEPIQPGVWAEEPAAAVSTEMRTAIHGMLVRILGWDRAVLRALPREIPSQLAALEMREAPVLTQILRNTLYCKVYSYPFDLTTAYNHLIVIYLLALTMQAAASPLTDDMWRELGSLGVHGLLKSVLHEGMPEGFRALLGTADFGLWMLAA